MVAVELELQGKPNVAHLAPHFLLNKRLSCACCPFQMPQEAALLCGQMQKRAVETSLLREASEAGAWIQLPLPLALPQDTTVLGVFLRSMWEACAFSLIRKLDCGLQIEELGMSLFKVEEMKRGRLDDSYAFYTKLR